jgi:hypothetical protein
VDSFANANNDFDDCADRAQIDDANHQRTRACELLNWAKSHAFQPRQGISELKKGQLSQRGIENRSHIGKYFTNLNDLQTDELLTALLTTVTLRRTRC